MTVRGVTEDFLDDFDSSKKDDTNDDVNQGNNSNANGPRANDGSSGNVNVGSGLVPMITASDLVGALEGVRINAVVTDSSATGVEDLVEFSPLPT